MYFSNCLEQVSIFGKQDNKLRYLVSYSIFSEIHQYVLMLRTFSIKHSQSGCDLNAYLHFHRNYQLTIVFVNYKHHNLSLFRWPMFNMIMLCQFSPGLEFLVTETAFKFLPIERIEFHYFYYDTCCI